jgi:Divergent InlB B-repeat domain
VASSSGDRAAAAYDRALRAFEERAYDVARSWALHALQENPQHAPARALLARLDAPRPPANPFEPQTSTSTHAGGGSYGGSSARKGPEPISVDPNVLISRASGSEASEPIEPTMIIQRDDPRLRLSGARVRAPAPPPPLPYTPEPPVAEPTVIVQPKPRSSTGARSSVAAGSGGPSLWQRLRSGGSQSAAPRRPAPTGRVGTTSDRRPGIGGPELRGALIAIAAVAVASLFVWGAIVGWRWMWPAGELLTIKKPVGGTITGHGLRCGTLGSDCSTTLPTGDRVQLEATADADYVYSGFTGDCSATGVSLMSEPRTCGATFDPVGTVAPTVTFTLTIAKPTGGTVVGLGDILCGTLGSTCSAALPSGERVNLRYEADLGYAFSQFTGDCGPNGEITMTAARTCSATFTPTTTGGQYVPPSTPPGPNRPPGPSGPKSGTKDPVVTSPSPSPPPPPPAPGSQLPTGPQTTTSGASGGESTPPPPGPDKPAPAAISAEEHAKKEIDQLVKNYCAALETREPDKVKEWFPLAPRDELRERFRQYKSLKCTLPAPFEYERLDAGPAGVAQVKFEMKQVIQMKSGGAPQKYETIVYMTVSRLKFQSPWFIDRMRAEQKPAP